MKPQELTSRCTWVDQSVKRLTLGFSSGHDPRLMGLSPAWSLLGILSLPLPLPHLRACSRSLALSLSLKKRRIEINLKKELTSLADFLVTPMLLVADHTLRTIL